MGNLYKELSADEDKKKFFYDLYELSKTKTKWTRTVFNAIASAVSKRIPNPLDQDFNRALKTWRGETSETTPANGRLYFEQLKTEYDAIGSVALNIPSIADLMIMCRNYLKWASEKREKFSLND